MFFDNACILVLIFLSENSRSDIQIHLKLERMKG